MSLIFLCCNHFNVKIKLRNHRSRSILNCYADKFKWNRNHMIYFSIKSRTELHGFFSEIELWFQFNIFPFNIWHEIQFYSDFKICHSLNIFWWFHFCFKFVHLAIYLLAFSIIFNKSFILFLFDVFYALNW